MPPPSLGWAVLLLFLVFVVSSTPALSARLDKPLMGWSTWESFAKHISDDKIMANVRLLQSTGLQAKGYTMIQIDDGWQTLNRETGWVSRVNYPNRPNNKQAPGNLPKMYNNGPAGCIVPDANKFPRGLKAMADEFKEMGFKFGLYTSGATFMCDAEPGFLGLYTSTPYDNLRDKDAACFREWGIDLLKMDACKPDSYSQQYYANTLAYWRRALDNNVILYNCRFGCMAATSCTNVYNCPRQTVPSKNNAVAEYCTTLSDLSRTGPDIKPYWDMILDSISTVFGRGKVSRPGFWSDPDYLVPSTSKLHFVERRSQFSMWCVVSAPLLISQDLGSLDRETIDMLGDEDAIAVNQVYEGDAGDLKRKRGNLWELQKQFNARTAVVLVNVGGEDTQVFSPFDASKQLVWTPIMADFGSATYAYCEYYNVWTKERGTLSADSRFTIAERDSLFLLVSSCSMTAPATPSPIPSVEDVITTAPTTSPTSAATLERKSGGADCFMAQGTTQKICREKAAKCNMKWVGTGCIVKGVKLNDGGCRCGQFCAYGCASVCRRDKQCKWNAKEQVCYNRATNLPGQKSTEPHCYL